MFERISGKIQRYVKGVSRKFQGCSKKDFRMLQERLKVFQWSFEWVSGELVFEGSLQGVSRMFQGIF